MASLLHTCVDQFDGPPGQLIERQGPGGPARSDRMAVDTGKLWAPGKALTVRFMDGAASLHAEVLAIARQWSEHASITFVESDAEDADIRVSFAGRDNWSRIGRQSREPMQPGGFLGDEPSMMLASVPGATDDFRQRYVLHEFGHALGCLHEHQSPAGGIPWNREAVYDRYDPPWTRQRIDENFYARYDATMTQFSAFDPQSIMLYPIEAELLTDPARAVGWNKALSAQDKAFIATLYPKAPGQR
jgi:serralysin